MQLSCLQVKMKLTTRACAVALCLSGIFLFYCCSLRDERSYKFSKPPEDFNASLLLYSKDRMLFLSSVDFSYVSMAINLYETSYKRLGIDNYLFLCSDMESHATLQEHGIHSKPFIQKVSEEASKWGTAAFKFKAHIKTFIMTYALRLGLTVLIVDVDIVLLKNPLPYLNCADCDIEIQSDGKSVNSGFYLARPTNSSMMLFDESLETILNDPTVGEQKSLNRHINSMQKQGKLNAKILNEDLFPYGTIYFENKKRMFYIDNPPTSEVLVHNNWILNKAAKVYRFKELLLWMTDTEGYYSDPERRYLYYSNPHDVGKENTQAAETEALKTAFVIGHLLNRTVILPSFTCYGCSFGSCKVARGECNLLPHYSLVSLDAVLENKYREHVFLHHPLVPESIKVQSAHSYFIKTNTLPNIYTNDNVPMKGVEILTPQDSSKGPTPDEIIAWFSQNQEPVLKFHSLYSILKPLCAIDFCKEVKQAINEYVGYRQFPKNFGQSLLFRLGY